MNEKTQDTRVVRIGECNVHIRFVPQDNPAVIQGMKQILLHPFLPPKICKKQENMR